MEIIEAFKKAIENEEKAALLYRETASKTNNVIIQRTMEFLADWEDSHIGKIEKMMKHILGEKIDISKLTQDKPKSTVRDFYGKNIQDFKKELNKASQDELEVYETGMNIEDAGHDFYGEMAEKADDEDVRKFFKFLEDEEEVHLEFLKEQHKFLKDPANFHIKEW